MAFARGATAAGARQRMALARAAANARQTAQAGRRGYDRGDYAVPGVAIVAGDHLAFRSALEERAPNNFQLPELHRRALLLAGDDTDRQTARSTLTDNPPRRAGPASLATRAGSRRSIRPRSVASPSYGSAHGS